MKNSYPAVIIFCCTFLFFTTLTAYKQKVWPFQNQKKYEFLSDDCWGPDIETDSITIKIENGENYKFRRFGEN